MNIMGKKTKYDMIPVEQWMATNPNIAKAQEEWFEMDMVNIQSKADDSIVHLLLDSWKSNAATRPNVLTATWVLSRICEEIKG